MLGLVRCAVKMVETADLKCAYRSVLPQANAGLIVRKSYAASNSRRRPAVMLAYSRDRAKNQVLVYNLCETLRLPGSARRGDTYRSSYRSELRFLPRRRAFGTASSRLPPETGMGFRFSSGHSILSPTAAVRARGSIGAWGCCPFFRSPPPPPPCRG